MAKGLYVSGKEKAISDYISVGIIDGNDQLVESHMLYSIAMKIYEDARTKSLEPAYSIPAALISKDKNNSDDLIFINYGIANDNGKRILFGPGLIIDRVLNDILELEIKEIIQPVLYVISPDKPPELNKIENMLDQPEGKHGNNLRKIREELIEVNKRNRLITGLDQNEDYKMLLKGLRHSYLTIPGPRLK